VKALGLLPPLVVALVLAGEVQACVCAALPLEERLDDADAAVVGRIVTTRETIVRGVRQSLFTINVLQQVKGDVPRELVVTSPLGTDCDLVDAATPPVEPDGTTGLLLTRSPNGAWLGSACSVAAAGELVAAGGEPRGGAIKVVVGLLFLAIVVSWALRRRARGARPRLPGAPEP